MRFGAIAYRLHDGGCQRVQAEAYVLQRGVEQRSVARIQGDQTLLGGEQVLPEPGKRLLIANGQARQKPGPAEAAKSSGSQLANLLKMTVYVSNRQDLDVFDAVRTQFIDDADLPALECVCVFGPGPIADALVQIEAIGSN